MKLCNKTIFARTAGTKHKKDRTHELISSRESMKLTHHRVPLARVYQQRPSTKKLMIASDRQTAHLLILNDSSLKKWAILDAVSIKTILTARVLFLLHEGDETTLIR